MTRNARAWRAGMVTTGAAVNPSEMAGRVNGSAVLRCAPALRVTPQARCGSEARYGGRPGLPAPRRGEHRKATGELVTTGALRHGARARLEDKPRAGVEGGLELVALFPSPSHGFLVTERAAGTCGWRERAPWGRFGDRPADPLRVLDL